LNEFNIQKYKCINQHKLIEKKSNAINIYILMSKSNDNNIVIYYNNNNIIIFQISEQIRQALGPNPQDTRNLISFLKTSELYTLI